MELIDFKGRHFKQTMLGEIPPNLFLRRVVQACQSDMGVEFSFFLRQPQLPKLIVHFLFELHEPFVFLHANPQDFGLFAWWKKSNPLECERKGRHVELGEGIAYVIKKAAVHFTHKTQGEMESVHPSGRVH